MDNEARIAELELKLRQVMEKQQQLTDRQEILDCVARHARGCDRFDTEVLSSAFFEDGVDEHGYAINPGHKYGEWANMMHARGALQNMHNITTHSCEIDGDVAHAESYVIGLFLNTPDGQTGRLLAGRYLDRLERRDGEWKIVLRRSTVEVAMEADASFLSKPYFLEMGFLKGLRDRRDASYQRPLTLEETPEGQRWPSALPAEG
jgi:hypothetical protein